MQSQTKYFKSLLPKISKSSIFQLSEEAKSIFKTNILKFLEILSDFLKFIDNNNLPNIIILKTLSIPYFKDYLLVSSKKDIEFLDRLQILYKKNENSDNSILKFLSRIQFDSFPHLEISINWILKAINEELEIKDFSNFSQSKTKILLNIFLNISTKLPNKSQNEYIISIISKFKNFILIFRQNDLYLDENFLKLLCVSLRVLSFQLEFYPPSDSIKSDSQFLENIFSIIFRSMFLGTSFQSILYPKKLNKSKENIFNNISSASEMSEFEGIKSGENGQMEDLYIKVRNYSSISLQILSKTSQKLLINVWQIALKCPHLSKDIIFDSKPVFLEPSLLFLVYYERNAKVRMNIINAIISILNSLPVKQWLLSGKYEQKEKIESFQPFSQQLFNCLININWIFLGAIFKEKEIGILAHLIKMYAGLMMAGFFNKIKAENHFFSFEKIFLPILKNNNNNIVLIAIINCFSGIFFNFKINEIEKKYFDELIKFIFKKIFENLNDFNFVSEILIFLGKIPKNYKEKFIEFLPEFIDLWKILEDNEKIMIFFYKIIEEMLKTVENDDFSDENTRNEIENKELTKNESNLMLFLKPKLLKGLSSENSDILQSVLSIFSSLPNNIFQLFFNLDSDFIINSFKNLYKNTVKNLKTLLCRTLGSFSLINLFNSNEKLIIIILNILISDEFSDNNNARIRNSWALASWTSSISLNKNYKVIFIDLFNFIIGFCNDKKEKVASNGFRCLGFLIKNIEIDCFYEFFNENLVFSIEKLIWDNLERENPKITWNICVFLQNILEKKDFFYKIANAKLYEKLLEIIKNGKNFKSQSHCIETLRFFLMENQLFEKTIDIFIEKSEKLEEEITNFADYKILDELEFKLLIFIMEIISKSSKNNEIIIKNKFLKENKDKLENFISKFIKLLGKNLGGKQEKCYDEAKEEEKMKKPLINKEESLIKGEEGFHKLILLLEGEFKERIIKNTSIFKEFCMKICEIIDKNDDISIGFIHYDLLKEYSLLELNQEIISIKFLNN